MDIIDILEKRYLILTAVSEEGTFHVYSEEESIKPGDLILVEGKEKPLEVTAAEYYAIDELDLPLESMLTVKEVAVEEGEVLSSRTQSMMSKVSESEAKIQEEEERIEEEEIAEETAAEVSEEEAKEEEAEEKLEEGVLSISLKMDSSFSLISYETDLAIHVYDRANKRYEKSEFAFIEELRLNNPTDLTLRGLRMVFRFADRILSCDETLLPSLEYREEISIRPPFIKVNREALTRLDAPLASSLTIELYSPKGRLLAQKAENFFLLPIGEMNHFFHYDPRLWCKFVTPMAKEIREFTLFSAPSSPFGRYSAYQHSDINDRAKELAHVYESLVSKGISYQNPPAGTTPFQKVRLPSQVLKDHKGTCLDLSILYAASVEEIGFHPILIILDDHAMVGVFLNENDRFENSRLAKLGQFYNRLTGKGDILVLNAVDLTNPAISFKSALNDATEILRNYEGKEFLACDIVSAHKGIFSPIPTEDDGSELDPEALYRKALEEELDPILEHNYREVHHEVNKDRFSFWENKLLDLTEKNPLVNFHFSPTNFVKLVRPNLSEFLLKEDPLSLRFVETGSGGRNDQIGDILSANVSSIPTGSDLNYGYLFGKMRSFRSILSKNQSEVEETGAATLYLCMGLLTYQSSDKKRHAKKAHAPFMLLPIKIERSGIGTTNYTMVYDYDDAMVNKTFFEYYKIDHPDFDISPLYKSSKGERDSFNDLVMTFKDKVSDDISLDETTFFIANLTFAHYIMWTDMVLRKEELRKNKVVSSIVSRESFLEETGMDSKSIEKEEHYRDFAAPLPYDSTQLSAILEASEGKSFILDGPPGTGKSQTIVNIIVNAIYHGKTVLFVAEKKAALDVVADRLKKIKLDRFTLELHSTKANKRDFFAKLSESIRLGPTGGEGKFLPTVEELEEKRKSIKEKVTAMHEAKDYCLSFFEAITLDLNLSSKAKPFPYPKEKIKRAKRADYFKSIDFLNRYVALTKNYVGIEKSGLKRVGLDFFSYNDVEDARVDFASFKEDLEDLIRKESALFEGSRLNLTLTSQNIDLLLKTFALAMNENVYADKLENYLLLESKKTFDPLIHKAEVLLGYKEKLEPRFDLVKLQMMDTEGAIEKLNSATSFLNKLSANSYASKTLQNAAKPKQKFDKSEYLALLKTIGEYQKLYREVQGESFTFDKYLPYSFLANIDKLQEIVTCFTLTYDLASNIKRIELLPGGEDAAPYFIGVASKRDLRDARHLDFTLKAVEKVKESESHFFSKYSLKPSDFEVQGELPLDLLLGMLEEGAKEGEATKLVNIASMNHFAKTEGNALTEPVILAFKKGEIGLGEIVPSFEETYAKEVIRLYFASNRLINDFHSSVFDEEIAKYRELIKQYSNLVIEEVTARATKNLTMGRYEYKDSSPVGRLKTIVSNGGRGTTIRGILERYDQIIRGYFPVFLMSPLSAAQYLSVDTKKVKPFDIVIFDEASQIPVHEAIGPIARGTSLIVAGDPKQMPPTSYFSTDLNLSGDDLDYQDASSLLDECLAIDFPRIRLSYHYRSRSESLIHFSNQNFYDDELHTFPAPYRGGRAIRFEKVELSEAKTDSKMSAEETKAILARLSRVYSKESNKEKSVGIIVFNIKQKESLEKALETYLEKDKKLALAIKTAEEATGEPLFIKSIENVQGDERDIILLCIGFRKTAAGRAYIVGPMAAVGGERRLNVAISRSKERMYVISTITDEDFDNDAYITNKGSLLLKHFLAYAKGEEEDYRSEEGEIVAPTRLTIADFIRKDLEQMGYLCDSNVGESKNKVDIAIRGEALNTYALGILVDDDAEISGATLRDKEYVEPTVFNHLNWKIIKVYAVSYYKDKTAVLQRILGAMDKPFIKMEEKIEPNLTPKEFDTSYRYKDYEKVDMSTLDTITYRSDQGFSRAVVPAISRIIYVEGPVSLSTIKSRIKEKCGLMVLSRLAQLLLEKEMKAFDYLLDERGFYWPLDKEKELVEYRLCGDRDIVEIPYEEFECAFSQIIERQGELEENDLFKATLEAFQYKNAILNKKNKEVLSDMLAIFREKHPRK